MMNVQEFQCPDFSNPSGEARQAVRPHKDVAFATHPDQVQAIKVAEMDQHFKLDQNVAGQLGLREKEKQAAEARINAEIEKRWEIASGKAEAAGYTKGLEEGKKEAYQAELPRIKDRVEALDNLLKEFDSFRQKIFEANESFLMDLIAQIAGMVALKEISLDQDYIRRLVTALLKQLSAKEDIKIFLSPADYANSQSLFQLLEKEFGKLANTSIEQNEAIPPSGCRIETRFGVVESSVVAQVDNLMRSVKG